PSFTRRSPSATSLLERWYRTIAEAIPAAAIPTKMIAVHGRVGSKMFWYMRNPTKVATSAATDPNVTASNIRPEMPRSLPPSVSAGLAATGTGDVREDFRDDLGDLRDRRRGRDLGRFVPLRGLDLDQEGVEQLLGHFLVDVRL